MPACAKRSLYEMEAYWADSMGCRNISTMEVLYGKTKGVDARENRSACEGFFGRLKTELFYPRRWRDTTTDQFMQIVDSYIRWYNEKRIKISLGSLSPLEYRANLGFTA